MVTTYLIIAHLVNDFLLQPRKLIEWKIKSAKGVIAHTVILFFVSLGFLFPYLGNWEVWAVLVGISVVHFFVDQAKINIALKYDNYPLPFIADQAIHFLSIIIGGSLLRNVVEFEWTWFYQNVYSNNWVIVLLLAIVFVGYIVGILFFQKKPLKLPAKFAGKEKSAHASSGMKIGLFTFVYIFYVAAALLIR
jgi:hypothetical protein